MLQSEVGTPTHDGASALVAAACKSKFRPFWPLNAVFVPEHEKNPTVCTPHKLGGGFWPITCTIANAQKREFAILATPPVVISVLASVGGYMQEIADLALSR